MNQLPYQKSSHLIHVRRDLCGPLDLRGVGEAALQTLHCRFDSLDWQMTPQSSVAQLAKIRAWKPDCEQLNALDRLPPKA